MSRKRRFQAWNLDLAIRSWTQNRSNVKPLVCCGERDRAKHRELGVGALAIG